MICPLLSRCTKQVDFNTYRNVCSNMTEDAYKKCPEYIKIAGELKKPSEWASLLSLVPTS